MLQAHTYWRMHGLSTDLVILNEEAGSYEQPLQERLEQLIQTHALSAAADRAGGIFLKNAAQIPEEDLKLLKATACVVLVAARGTLPQQLGARWSLPSRRQHWSGNASPGTPRPRCPSWS
jgi:cyclic beta-1,2-glucan synthetase